MCPNLDFWFENKPSGNPAQRKAIEQLNAKYLVSLSDYFPRFGGAQMSKKCRKNVEKMSKKCRKNVEKMSKKCRKCRKSSFSGKRKNRVRGQQTLTQGNC
jgi:hypothetical protein